MLSREKFYKLAALTDHPKFGKLLKQSIINWGKVNPSRRTFGIFRDIFTYEKHSEEGGCCLIGSALVGEKHSAGYSMVDLIEKQYNLSNSEFWGLSDGFDDRAYSCNTSLEAYNFGKQVSEICFEE